MYPLEASDEYGIEGLPDREALLVWLDSWLRDEDSRSCKIEKLSFYKPDKYTVP
jgi:hypothetical protein